MNEEIHHDASDRLEAEATTFDRTVDVAFQAALERLTPAERVSFVLHDLFELGFAQIAETVGRTPTACRRLAASARRNLQQDLRFDVEGGRHGVIVRAFLSACRGDDLAGLMETLDPGVRSAADGGDSLTTPEHRVVGAEAVARYLLDDVMKAQRQRLVDPQWEISQIDGRSAIVIRDLGRLAGSIHFAVSDGLITRIAIHANSNPLEES